MERTLPALTRWLALGVATVLAWQLVVWITISMDPASDGLVYWQAWQGPLYATDPQVGRPNYLYSPAFAALLWPLAQLPLDGFLIVWTVLGAAAYWWLLAPLRWWRAPVFVACCGALWIGNIEWLLALSAVVGLRYPAAWALPLLSKVTPGVGVLWFAARGEWRSLGVAAGATVLVTAISIALAPDLWVQWIRLLLTNSGGGVAWPYWVPNVPIVLRLIGAAALTVWGARTGRAWVIPVAMVLAQPDLRPWTLAVLAAVPRLRLRDPDVARQPRSHTAGPSLDDPRLPA